MNIVEQGLDSIGLMRGPNAPALRAALGGLVGGYVVQTVQPQSMYINGQPRPWALWSSDPNATILPWFALPVFGAFVLGVLI